MHIAFRGCRCFFIAVLPSVFCPTVSTADDPAASAFRIELTEAHRGFDGKTCWVHARAGIVPRTDKTMPLVVMTTQKLLLSGSDVFYALNELRTGDGGRSWTAPSPHETLSRRPFEDGEILICDFTPTWHRATGKLLGTGHTVVYRDNRIPHARRRNPAYAVYDADQHTWSRWDVVELPDLPEFENAGSGSTQRVDLPDGDILLPIYFREFDARQYGTTVLRCRFDGKKLSYVEHGSRHTVPIKRGLYEPSLTRFQGRYYLTMRNDDRGYVTHGSDGLNFDEPIPWTFDDGKDLGNYNTQQHWVTHSDALYLVYTRRGADNDHVFRHRAPLFIAEVDPDRLCVLRDTEQILVPEHGARLGNFGIVDVSPHETWVTVTEWMQPVGVEKYGSDNRIFVAKLHWRNPNAALKAP